MAGFLAFIQNNVTVIVLGAYMVFSSAVSALIEPTDKSGPWYTWFYRFTNNLANNVAAFRTHSLPPTPVQQHRNDDPTNISQSK